MVPSGTITVTLEKNTACTVTKYITYCWGRSGAGLDGEAAGICRAFAAGGLLKAAGEQQEYLASFWNIARIHIDGDPVDWKILDH